MGTSIEWKPNHGIYFGQMPGRKSLALCVQEGSVIYTVAYFRNQEEYDRFGAAMKHLIGAFGGPNAEG